MSSSIKPLNEITRHAIEVLSKEIGIPDTLRFVTQFTSGYGDYTEERERLFAGQTLDEILDAIRNRDTPPA